MNAADVIAQRLYAAGVRYAFGIPGGEVLTLIDALERAGIRFVLTKHENAAGFMAEGAWHATGAPAVLVATVGPGIANAFNVVANAEQDRVPMIVLSGMVDPAEALSYTHQVFDHGAAFARVCKASFVAPHGAVDVLADKAIRIAMSPRKGPVHIDLPIAIADADQPEARAPRIAVEGLTAPHGEALAAARAKFLAAKRPVIMAGLDVLEEPGGPATVQTFAEQHQIPVVTTYKGKGILPEDHPLSLGGHGLSPKADKIILPIFEDADCILSLGYDPIEMRAGWRDPWDPSKVIEFTHAPNTHDMHFAEAAWVCSITGGLDALAGAGTSEWGARPAETRQALLDTISPIGDWGPDHAMSEITKVLPANTLSSVDSGAHRILLSQHLFCRQPRALVQSTALCTMGCALPLALGHKVADPSRPAVCFIGDACLEMTIGELATVRDIGLPIVIVVFVDSSLSLIELKQRRSGMQNAGVDFLRTDFAAMARLYGGNAITVKGPGEAGPAMQEALTGDRFTLIEVEIPRRAYDGLI
ncbi:MAG: thiamine pyrophosphate-binding protein [Pseudomonadota bacterium]